MDQDSRKPLQHGSIRQPASRQLTIATRCVGLILFLFMCGPALFMVSNFFITLDSIDGFDATLAAETKRPPHDPGPKAGAPAEPAKPMPAKPVLPPSDPRKPYPLTDAMDPAQANLRIVGVTHTSSSFFSQEGRHVTDAIKSADAIMMERGAGYFDSLAIYAAKQGKKVYFVDPRGTEELPAMLSILIPLCAIETLVYLALCRHPTWPRLAGYLVAGVIVATQVFPNPVAINIGRAGQVMFPSWIAEGRTIHMIDRSREIAASLPIGAKALYLAGDWHASSALWYVHHPQTLAIHRFIMKSLWAWLPVQGPAEILMQNGKPVSRLTSFAADS